ncbi:MAG: glycosyltransferase family 39 protein [Mariprofundaceae bacterium]|nr:glycosyltransferase family 39 protein [Mariprofundaceae bacterium]
MKRVPNISDKHFPWWLLLPWAALTLPSLGLAPLFDYDETIYAQTAIDMMRHGEWIVPTANGMQFFEKPPFTYYLMDISFILFGENAFAARLPSGMFTLFTSLLLLHFGRRVHSPAFGLAAAVIFLTMLEVGVLGHAAILDAVLNFFIAATLLYYFLWRQLGDQRDALITAAMMGAAVSIKGPVGAVIPVLVIIIDRLLVKDLGNTLRAIPWLSALGLFLITATPWYLMILINHGPGFLYEFIMVHNIGRALNPMQGHGGGWHYYLVVFVASVLPWLAWVIWGGRTGWDRYSRETLPAIVRFGIIWTLLVMVLFTFAQTKLPHYISSIYPGVALIIAAALFYRGLNSAVPKSIYLASGFILLPVALLLTALPALYPQLTGLVRHPRAVAIVSQDITPSIWISLAGVLLLACVFWLLLCSRKASGNHLFRFTVTGIVLQSTLLIGLGTFAGNLIQAPAMRIADEVQRLPAGVPVYSYNLNAPSISFYSGKPYRILLNNEGTAVVSTATAPYALVMRSESAGDIARLEGIVPHIDQGGYLMYIITPDSKRHESK